MKRFFVTLVLFFAGLQIFAAIAVPQGLGGPQVPVAKATIEGTVVRSVTGEAVSRAQITIVRNAPTPGGPGQPNPAANQGAPAAGQRGAPPQGAQGQPNAAAAQTPSIAPVFTDNQGKFQITDLEPGNYRLFAARNGYTRMEYGQKLMNRPGTVLNVTSGQVMKDVAFKLTPAGTVTGRIVDELGEPLPGLTVQILRSTYDQNGKRTLQPTSNAKTNDLGEYRVYFVPPGRYFVSALAAAPGFDAILAAATNPGGANTNEVVAPGYVQTYFPNTTDYTRAATIEVLPGSEVSAIHFTMARQQRFHVKGRVTDLTTGTPPQVAQLSLSPRNSAVAQNPLDSILGAAAGGNNYNSADGTFDVRDVAPGSYWLQTMAMATPPAGAAQGAAGAAAAVLASMMTAIQPVEVSGADVDNLTIAVGGGLTIPGRVQVEGTAPPAFGFDRIALSLNPTSGVVTLGSLLQVARPGSDGAFSLEKVNAGEYRFAIQGLPPAMYVKSARFDQTDILAAGFSVTDRAPGTLQVVVSANSGQIDGNVVDKDSKTLRGIPTVLIPDRNRERRELFKFAQTDQNGHFNLDGIAPGDYKLFAWEDIEPFSYFDPEVMKQFEEKGKPVHVVETTKETVEVSLIPAVTP